MQHPVKKRRTRTDRPWLKWVLVATALLCAAALFLLVPVIKSRVPSPNDLPLPQGSPVRTLYLGQESELESLLIAPADGDAFTLRMQNGRLHLQQGDSLLPINEAFAEDLVKVATQIVVQNTVTDHAAEVADQLAEMGLAPPLVTAQATYRDGSAITLEVGAPVPGTTYAYYRWSGDDGVYMCDPGITDALFLTPQRLLPVPTLSIVPELVSSLTLTTPTDEMQLSFLQDDSGFLSGTMETPYRYPMDAEQTAALATALGSLRLGTTEGAVTNENRAFYGLDAPLCRIHVEQADGYSLDTDENGALVTKPVAALELSLTIGRAEGDYFYTCEYAGNVYLVSRLTVEALVNATPAKLCARNAADLGDTALASVMLQTQERTIQVTVADDASITLNGEPMQQTAFDTLIDRLRTLTAAGDLPPDWSPDAAQAPLWRMELMTEGGLKRCIEGYPLDAFSNALCVDGVFRHYVHSEAIERIVADLLP